MSPASASYDRAQLFSALYRKHYKEVYRHALALHKCTYAANDLTQEVFLNFWKKITDPSLITDIPSYLFIQTRNQFLNAQRRIKREQVSLDEYTRHYRQLWPPPLQDPVQEKEYFALVRKAIQQLPLRQRQVMVLRTEASLPRKEIAARLGLSELTVKMHRERAVKAVREYLEIYQF